MIRLIHYISFWFLLTCGVAAYADAGVDPLFESHEPIEARLVTPVARIMRDRPIEEYVPGTFSFIDVDGEVVEFEVGIRTRGNFRRRLEICKFAPLRLNFKKSQTKDTLFDKQDKLKLVTHCQSGSPRYQQSVLSEYLAYRVLNLLTDVSFRVRLLRITYVDNEKDNKEMASLGILIENTERLAKRIDAKMVQIRMITIPDLLPEYANFTSVFHYFTGNTDFSQIATAPGEDCCHNHELLAVPDGRYYSVPYDFDMTGFVNAPHARPNSRFGLRSVRDRLYRGRCVNNAYLPASAQQFVEKRDEIYALINAQDLMTKGTRKSQEKFVDSFYKDIESASKIEKKLAEDCI